MKLNIFPLFGIATLASGLFVPSAGQQGGDDFQNAFGVARTVSSNGPIDTTGPFFQSLGTNGRSCNTCHIENQNWGISAEDVQRRFERSQGMDPIFRTVDGSNSPNSAVRTLQQRRSAYSMLLNKGVIRIERPIPAGAEFSLVSVDDPYGYASAAGLSLFRRPLPTTNLGVISTVMWDGREVNPANPMKIANSPFVNRAILEASLAHQALDATSLHAQGSVPLTDEQQNGIVEFELGLASAQVRDNDAGWLNNSAALGGPENILTFPFYIGINDNVADPQGPFNAASMTLYQRWSDSRDFDRASVARGEAVFNSKPIVITGVKGLNNNPYFGSPTTLTGTCTTCHNTPQMGNHSLAIALDIGLTDKSRRTPDMPLYTLRNRTTGEEIKTTDPGLALSTGKWSDIARFKGPVLRGLAARAPYFHNGSAKDFDAVLDFYSHRFGVVFTKRERSDLISFLKTL